MEQQVIEKVEQEVVEQVEQKTETPNADKEQWDKNRQVVDQLKATIEKVQSEKADLADKMTSTQSKIAELEEKLTTKVETEKLALEEMDSSLVGDAIPKNFKKIHDELLATKKIMAELQRKAVVYEAAEKQRESENYRKNVENEICTELDSEFGSPKYRTEAVKLANKWVFEEKSERLPNDRLDAYKVLRKAYRQISEGSKQVTKKAVPTDSGVGTVAVGVDGIKAGSHQTVMEQLRNKFKT